MKKVIKAIIRGAARHSTTVQRLGEYIIDHNPRVWYSYAHLREAFIDNGEQSEFGQWERERLVDEFERIDETLPIATTPTDGIILAELALSVAEQSDREGHLVECGCYAGGSTAKLSIVASCIGCEVFVFDSFEGLPEVEDRERNDYHCRRNSEWVDPWEEGRYAGGLQVVQENIERCGRLERCRFIKGFFKETLNPGDLPDEIMLAFSDVDIASSAEQTLVRSWPHLVEGGVFVTHDAAYIKVLKRLKESELWWEGGENGRPILFGAGYGVCDRSPHMGYMVKGDNNGAGYLKSLTVVK